MAEELGQSYPEFLVRHTRMIDGHRSLNEHLTAYGYDCVFLDRESIPGKAVCRVYHARPSQCKTWPFWPQLMQSEMSWARAKRNTPCPGMGHGQLFTIEEIVSRLDREKGSEDKPW